MRLAGRLERLESGQGSPVSVAGWCDRSGMPFEPAAEFRTFVEQEAYRLQPDYTEWRWAVYLRGDNTGSMAVLLGEQGRLQIIEVGTHKPWAES